MPAQIVQFTYRTAPRRNHDSLLDLVLYTVYPSIHHRSTGVPAVAASYLRGDWSLVSCEHVRDARQHPLNAQSPMGWVKRWRKEEGEPEASGDGSQWPSPPPPSPSRLSTPCFDWRRDPNSSVTKSRLAIGSCALLYPEGLTLPNSTRSRGSRLLGVSDRMPLLPVAPPSLTPARPRRSSLTLATAARAPPQHRSQRPHLSHCTRVVVHPRLHARPSHGENGRHASKVEDGGVVKEELW